MHREIRKNNKMSKGTLTVDFFCGGGGMSYGMQESGIKVLAGIDFEPTCKETYEANIIGAQFLLEDVFKLKVQDLQKRLDLKRKMTI